MGYIVSLFLLLLLLILYSKRRTFSSPDVQFIFLWTIITFFASLRLFGLFSVSWKIWIIIIVGCISYLIGTFIGTKVKSKKIVSKNDYKDEKLFMSKKTFYILLSILLLFTIKDLVQSIHYMRLGYSLGEIREASVGMREIVGYTRHNGLYEYISLILSIIEIFIVSTGIANGIKDIKTNKYMLIGVIIYEIIKCFTFGGRFAIAYMIVEIIVCYSIYKKIYNTTIFKNSKKTKKIINKFIIFLVALIVLITIIRGAEAKQLAIKYYRYLCGNIVFFNSKINELESTDYISYSIAGLYGFYSVFFPIINIFGIPYPKIYLNTINYIMDTQTFRKIGTGMVTNAFITPFYHLYADFRIIGVIIGMILFGIIAGYLYKKVVVEKSNKSVIYFLIISQMIFKTIQFYPLSNKVYFWTLIVMLIINKKSKNEVTIIKNK